MYHMDNNNCKETIIDVHMRVINISLPRVINMVQITILLEKIDLDSVCT